VFGKGLSSKSITGISATTLTGAPKELPSQVGMGVGEEASFGSIIRVNDTGLSRLAGTTLITLALHMRYTASQGAFAGVCTIADESANHVVGLQVNSANSGVHLWAGNLASLVGVAFAAMPTTDAVYVARFSYSSSGVVALDVNGSRLLDSILNGTPGAMPAAPSRIIIGGERSSNASFTSKLRTYAAFAWTRWLSDQEVINVSADPYQFLSPA
jgi:hypothetical protein